MSFRTSFAAVVIFCGLGMATFDAPLAWFFKHHISGEYEGFFKVITTLGVATGWYVLAGVVLLGCFGLKTFVTVPEWRERCRAYARAAFFMISALTASGLVETGMKFVIGRYRPRYLFESGLYGFKPFNAHWAMNSFPSGHSQTIWAVAVALMFIYPRYNAAYIMVAILVSLSRAVTSVHFLSDVTMGSYIGIAVTVWLHRQFVRRGGSVRLGGLPPTPARGDAPNPLFD
ncbi:MAG: phosphatase PAP2 family protein [Alphaproteobacteria bacterium]|nr:phosphatase PAP2 family protein [Alphaproteobacteria bacterium]